MSNKNSTITVAILGGGIGGLSCAHVLVRQGFPGNQIHIFERNGDIGGQARSAWMGSPSLPGEYCCRIVGANYNTLRQIMREIPTTASKTVHDNLVDVDDYLLPKANGETLRINGTVLRAHKCE